MEKICVGFVILFIATTAIEKLQAFPIDYNERIENSINTNDRVFFQLGAVEDDFLDYDEQNAKDRELEQAMYIPDQKRNVISALRGKKKLPSSYGSEARLRFSPVLSVDALGNLNGFFANLANNLNTMENKNLLPSQMRLLGQSDIRHNSLLHPSSEFISSVRSYQSPTHIRQLMNFEPDSHLDSNFHDPVLRRIGLGK